MLHKTQLKREKGYKMSNVQLKTILKFLLPYILGILTFYLTQKVSSFLVRPIIIADLGSISIGKISTNNWETKFKILFNNTGKSPTTVQLKGISLFFPDFSARPLEFDVNTFFRIDEKTSNDVQFSTSFPSVFDEIKADNVPKLRKVTLKYATLENNKTCSLTIDSSRIFYMVGFGLEYFGPEKLLNARYDPLKKMVHYAIDKVFIEYNGKNYLNYVYPPGTHVEYSYDRDKIILKYQMLPKKSKIDTLSKLIEPVIFFPHRDLAEKIVLPKKIGVNLTIETRKTDLIKYCDYSLEFGEYLMTFLYLIN